MPLPDFIIFGTRKAGTTSLYHYLLEHPQIYMSALKGSRFFLYDPLQPERGKNVPIKTLDAYKAHFEGARAKGAKAIGEATPSYLNNSVAAKRIKETIPNVKLIASLRNPIDRTFSLYQMHARKRAAAEHIPLSLDNVSQWAASGCYHNYLKQYFELFDRDQIKIILFEEWAADPLAMLKDVYRFLDVDDSFVPELRAKYNTGGVPISKFVASIFGRKQLVLNLKPYVPKRVRLIATRVRALNMRPAPSPPPELRQYLREFFQDDILALQTLVRKDLSAWLEDRPAASSQ